MMFAALAGSNITFKTRQICCKRCLVDRRNNSIIKKQKEQPRLTTQSFEKTNKLSKYFDRIQNITKLSFLKDKHEMSLLPLEK